MKSFYPAYLQKKIVVLENPLDFDEMGKQCVGQDIEKENTVISVGRLEKQKDFVTLIKSYKAVAEKHPSWKLKIFGQGNRREELQNLIRKENLEENVKLCGVTHLYLCFTPSHWHVCMLQLLLRLGTFQLSDIFYNTVGGALGGLLYYVAMKARKRL